MAEIGLLDRDPNGINQHIKVQFEEVLAEPDGVHSLDCVWTNSYKCFNCWKNICYTISTLLCGVCLAAEWGCEFSLIAFYHVWVVTPCFKVLELNCGILKRLYGLCVHCCLDPCMESLGLCFGALRKP